MAKNCPGTHEGLQWVPKQAHHGTKAVKEETTARTPLGPRPSMGQRASNQY